MPDSLPCLLLRPPWPPASAPCLWSSFLLASTLTHSHRSAATLASSGILSVSSLVLSSLAASCLHRSQELTTCIHLASSSLWASRLSVSFLWASCLFSTSEFLLLLPPWPSCSPPRDSPLLSTLP